MGIYAISEQKHIITQIIKYTNTEILDKITCNGSTTLKENKYKIP